VSQNRTALRGILRLSMLAYVLVVPLQQPHRNLSFTTGSAMQVPMARQLQFLHGGLCERRGHPQLLLRGAAACEEAARLMKHLPVPYIAIEPWTEVTIGISRAQVPDAALPGGFSQGTFSRLPGGSRGVHAADPFLWARCCLSLAAKVRCRIGLPTSCNCLLT